MFEWETLTLEIVFRLVISSKNYSLRPTANKLMPRETASVTCLAHQQRAGILGFIFPDQLRGKGLLPPSRTPFWWLDARRLTARRPDAE